MTTRILNMMVAAGTIISIPPCELQPGPLITWPIVPPYRRFGDARSTINDYGMSYREHPSHPPPPRFSLPRPLLSLLSFVAYLPFVALLSFLPFFGCFPSFFQCTPEYIYIYFFALFFLFLQ